MNGCCRIHPRNVLLVNSHSTRINSRSNKVAFSSGESFVASVCWLPVGNSKQRSLQIGSINIRKLKNERCKALGFFWSSGPKVKAVGLDFGAYRGGESVTKTSASDTVAHTGPKLQFSAPEQGVSSSACDTERRGTCFSPFTVKFWLRPVTSAVVASILSAFLYLGTEALAFSDCGNLTTYYARLHGLKGQELKSRLHEIIKGHKVVSYIQAWDALKVLDEAEDDPDSVLSKLSVANREGFCTESNISAAVWSSIEIYSLKKVAKSRQAKIDGWNREHLWPRSYGLVMGRPEFSDLQNLRPADVNVNSSRGNKYYGECTTSDHCLVPANREAAVDTGTTRDLWMPPAQMRGDIARALMYMAVRYGSEQSELQLSDSPSVGTAQMGLLSDLLHWNEIDPPSPAEKLRNNRVCQLYQHNRNPFVDHPVYAKLIWGDALHPERIAHKTKKVDYDGKRLDNNQHVVQKE